MLFTESCWKLLVGNINIGIPECGSIACILFLGKKRKLFSKIVPASYLDDELQNCGLVSSYNP